MHGIRTLRVGAKRGFVGASAVLVGALALAAGGCAAQRVYFEPDADLARPPDPGHLAIARIALRAADGRRIGSVRIASQGVYEAQVSPDSGQVPVLQVQLRVVNTSSEPFTFDPSRQLVTQLDGLGSLVPIRTFSEGRELKGVATIPPGTARRFDLIYRVSGVKPKSLEHFTLSWQVGTPSGPHGRAERFTRLAPGSYYYPERSYAGYWQGYYYPGYWYMPGWGAGLFVGPGEGEEGEEGFYGPEEGEEGFYGPGEGEGEGYAPEEGEGEEGEGIAPEGEGRGGDEGGEEGGEEEGEGGERGGEGR